MSVIFPFAPDWNTMMLLMKFNSDVSISDSDCETRTARQSFPALGIQFAVAGDRNGIQFVKPLESFLTLNIGQRLLIPLWPLGVKLTADAGTGSSVLAVSDTTDRMFSDDTGTNPRQYVIWTGDKAGSYEAVTLSAITQNSLTLSTGQTTVNSYSNGKTYIVPAIRTEPMSSGSMLSYIHAAMAHGSLTFSEALEQSCALGVIAPGSLPTYGGIPIFPIKLDWNKEPAYSVEAKTGLQIYDGAVAGPRFFTQSNPSNPWITVETTQSLFPRLTLSYDIIGMTIAEIRAAYSAFAACLGQYARLWTPSGKADFALVSKPTGTAASIICLPTGFAAAFASEGSRRAYIFVLDGAKWQARKIVTVTINGDGNEVITFDSALTGLSGRESYCFLYLMRFDTSDLTFTYFHSTAATASVKFIELPNEYSEQYDSPEAPPDPASGSVVGNLISQ